MLDSALYWLSGFYLYMWISAFSGMLMLDAPRYVLSKVVLVVFDAFRAPFRRRGAVPPPHYPTVCAILSQHKITPSRWLRRSGRLPTMSTAGWGLEDDLITDLASIVTLWTNKVEICAEC